MFNVVQEVQLIREAEERRLLEETATAQIFPCTHIDVGAEAKTQAREDPKMRKRAEQSARDKARYQRMRMEKDRLPLKHENTNQVGQHNQRGSLGTDSIICP